MLVGEQLFTTYYFDPSVAKLYFQPLRSAQGTIVTRDFPNGDCAPPEYLKDPNLEPHQRPIYFGHGDIDAIDFWGAVLLRDGDRGYRAPFVALEEV